MSKSLGNLVMVRDLLKHCSADALRLYLAGHHYRRAWAHDPDELARADRLVDRLRAAVTVPGHRGDALDPARAQADFTAAMNDDLDTPSAVARLERLADDILAAAGAARDVGPAQAVLRRLAQVFGLRLDAPGVEDRVVKGWSAHLERIAP